MLEYSKKNIFCHLTQKKESKIKLEISRKNEQKILKIWYPDIEIYLFQKTFLQY